MLGILESEIGEAVLNEQRIRELVYHRDPFCVTSLLRCEDGIIYRARFLEEGVFHGKITDDVHEIGTRDYQRLNGILEHEGL